MLEFLSIVISAAVVENLLFSRGFLSRSMLHDYNKPKSIFRVGLLVCGISTISSLVIWLLLNFSGQYFKTTMSKYSLIVVGIGLVYIGFYYLLHNHNQENADEIAHISFSGSCVAAVVLSITAKTNLINTLGYTIGASMGLTVAMLLLSSGRERMQSCRIPKIFSGIPIILIYLGILGLGFYGLLGHQLPT